MVFSMLHQVIKDIGQAGDEEKVRQDFFESSLEDVESGVALHGGRVRRPTGDGGHLDGKRGPDAGEKQEASRHVPRRSGAAAGNGLRPQHKAFGGHQFLHRGYSTGLGRRHHEPLKAGLQHTTVRTEPTRY